MEDYNSNLLNDSKNEWSIRLMNMLSGHIIDGFRSIFNEAMEVCDQNEEPEKYLMTFQNFLSRIPKWNQNMIETEGQRIITNSKCNYLDDLITCVHIIQLKILSCVRTSNHNKKIEIDIPNFTSFLHNVYINIARKLYSNIYLFQIDITSLEQQKNNREFENIVQSCIMNTIRDNIPIDHLLKQYIDETQELDIEKKEKIVKKEDVPPPVAETQPHSSGIILENKENELEPSVSSEQSVNPSPPINENISFSENVETYDPISKEISNEPMKEKPDVVNEEPYENDELLNIGESVSLSFDEDLEPEKKESNDIINLDFESIEEEPQQTKESLIDLGATELDL